MNLPNPFSDATRQLADSSKRWTRFDLLAVLILLIPLLCWPWVTRSAITSLQNNNNNDVISWADDDLPIKQQFQSFLEHFGRPELVVVSWPGCHYDAPELAQLETSITSAGDDGWFANVTTARSVLEKAGQVRGVSRSKIRRQMTGILLGQDGQAACLILELGPRGRTQRPTAINRIKDLAAQQGIDRQTLKIGGIGAELAWLDADSVDAPVRLLPAVALVAGLLSIWFVGSVRLGLFISTLGAFAGTLSAALIPWCGFQSNAITATLPTLGALLTISLSLHFVSYYRNAAAATGNRRESMRLAFAWATKPTLISALTTAIGLGSLMLSRTSTIQQFGGFGAMITTCAATLALTVLPSYLWLVPSSVQQKVADRSRRRWLSWDRFVQTRTRLIIFFVAISTLCVGAGLTKLKTGVHVNNMFVPRHEIIQNDRWLEENFGPLASLELVIETPIDQTDLQREKNLAPIHALTERLRRTESFKSVISAATGLPDVTTTRGLRGVAARVRLRHWVRDHHDELLSSGLYAQTDDSQLWRIAVRIPAMTETVTSDFSERLRVEVESFLSDYQRQNSGTEEFKYYITGLPLLFEQIEQQFVRDLLVTYSGGLALITLVVLIVLRNLSDAITAMIPNVLPAVGVLGGLSLCGIELDVGSVMTASIALGVAVDDTLHLVLWYQRQRRSGDGAKKAVRSSILHCGSPILQTSVICGFGMAVLSFATFVPTMRFGSLIAMMLGVALIGDLMFLPAMLSRKA